MPVEKDLSIVADSTVSSSSPAAMPVKRPARTYGRPKVTGWGEQQAYSLSQHPSSSSSDDQYLRTGLLGAREEVPASPEPPHSSSAYNSIGGDDDDENDVQDASRKFKWAWEKKMEDIDKGVDMEKLEKDAPVLDMSDEGSKQAVSSEPLLALQSASQDTHARTPTPPLRDSVNVTSQDIFGSSLATLTASSPARSVSPPITQKRVSRRARIDLSGSESEDEAPKSSYPSSPAIYTINTPKSRCSVTPPTSEPEMSGQPRKSASKEKAAVSISRKDVPPLLFETGQSPGKASSKGKRAKSGKIKAPTKKELRETALFNHRMNAEKEVSIPRAEARRTFALTQFFNDIQIPKANPVKPVNSFSSDPISEFSSPAHIARSNSAVSSHFGPSQSQNLETRAGPTDPEHVLEQDDEDEFPDPSELLDKLKGKAKADSSAERLQALNEAKQRILAQQQQQQRVADDSDDDLEIVDASGTSMQIAMDAEAEARRTGKKKHISAGRKMQAQFGGPSVIRASVSNRRVLRTKADWDRQLLQKAHADATEQVRRKEEEWIQRGGTLPAGRLGEQVPETNERELWVERGVQRANDSMKLGDNNEEEEEDAEDEDWTPSQRGSASPRSAPDENEDGAGYENEEFEDQDVTMVNEGQGNEQEESASQDDVVRRRSTRVVVASDSEDDESDNAIPKVPKMVHCRSDSSFDEATEDDGDKENNTRLMYDRSEDKENTAVVRHGLSSARPALGDRQSSLFNLEERVARNLSMSPGDREMLSDDGEDEKQVRSPLKPLRTEASFSLSPIPFAARLQRAASAASLSTPDDISAEPVPSPSLAPLVAHTRQNAGFSQFSEEGSESRAPKVLQAGSSDLFECGTEEQPSQSSRQPTRSSTGLKLFNKESTSTFSNLRKDESLDLTQDVGLQPALQVDERLKRKADSIFEKEQEFLLEAVNEDAVKEPQLYIDKHGFLTQTRPDSSPEIYRPPPTPSQPYSNDLYATQSQAQRQPFRELSVTDSYFDFTDKTPSNAGLRRLVKRGDSSSAPRTLQSDYSRAVLTPTPPASPSDHRQPPQRKNAFEVLGQKQKPRKRLERSEFVEGEAEESDEDEMFGFRTKKDDDEEDGEDLDKTLETLVDDKEMDDSVVAADKVMEKYQEHAQVDDIELEKYHMAAVQGEMRRKRKTMMGIDDSDEEEDEDERNRKIRRKMREHKIRDDIESLGKHPETKAFYETYAKGVNGEGDPELEYLLRENDSLGLNLNAEAALQSDGEDGSEIENDENSGPGSISRDEVLRQLREVARTGEEEETLDPTDTSWIDAMDLDEDEDGIRVKDISRRRRRAPDPVEYEGGSEVRYASHMIDEQNRNQSASWVKNENRMKRMGNARSVGGAAVTGHGAKKAWRGSSTSSATAIRGKPAPVVKAASSMLKAVDRSDRFK